MVVKYGQISAPSYLRTKSNQFRAEILDFHLLSPQQPQTISKVSRLEKRSQALAVITLYEINVQISKGQGWGERERCSFFLSVLKENVMLGCSLLS